jgi:hypothetical protein
MPTMAEIVRVTGVRDRKLFTQKRKTFEDCFFGAKKHFGWTWNLHSLSKFLHHEASLCEHP